VYKEIATLYGDDDEAIIKLINSSIYVTDIKGEVNALHTGFNFSIQNGKILEIHYDLLSNMLIRQPRPENFNFPCILGLFCFKNEEDQYIRRFRKKIVIGFSNADLLPEETLLVICELKDELKYLEEHFPSLIALKEELRTGSNEYSNFEVRDSNDELITSLPLHRTYKKLFYNSKVFSLHYQKFTPKWSLISDKEFLEENFGPMDDDEEYGLTHPNDEREPYYKYCEVCGSSNGCAMSDPQNCPMGRGI
jgi:hypothetical protein